MKLNLKKIIKVVLMLLVITGVVLIILILKNIGIISSTNSSIYARCSIYGTFLTVDITALTVIASLLGISIQLENYNKSFIKKSKISKISKLKSVMYKMSQKLNEIESYGTFNENDLIKNQLELNNLYLEIAFTKSEYIRTKLCEHFKKFDKLYSELNQLLILNIYSDKSYPREIQSHSEELNDKVQSLNKFIISNFIDRVNDLESSLINEKT